MQKINPYTVTIVLIVMAAVLTGVAATVKQVDINTLDSNVQQFWKVLVYIFTTSAVTPLFTFIANIYGYFTNKLEAPSSTRNEIQYQANLVLVTYLKLDGYIKGISLFAIAAFQGTPYADYAVYIAGAAAFVFDIVIRTVKKLASPTSTASMRINPEP